MQELLIGPLNMVTIYNGLILMNQQNESEYNIIHNVIIYITLTKCMLRKNVIVTIVRLV